MGGLLNVDYSDGASVHLSRNCGGIKVVAMAAMPLMDTMIRRSFLMRLMWPSMPLNGPSITRTFSPM